MKPVRLPPKAEAEILKRLGEPKPAQASVRDAKPRTIRKPKPEFVTGFLTQLRACRFPAMPVREHLFHPTRQWRFDLAWPDSFFAIEVDGGTFRQGAHTRGRHYASDCRKLAEAMALGWRVLRVTTDMVKSGEALTFMLKIRGWELDKNGHAVPLGGNPHEA